MTMIRSDGRQAVVNEAVEPGHSSAYDRTFGGSLNRIIGTCTGTSGYQIATGPCVFAGVELSSGAATVVSAYDAGATAASSNPFWSRSLSTAAGDGPANGPVLCANGLFLAFSTTTYSAKVLGITST